MTAVRRDVSMSTEVGTSEKASEGRSNPWKHKDKTNTRAFCKCNSSRANPKKACATSRVIGHALLRVSVFPHARSNLHDPLKRVLEVGIECCSPEHTSLAQDLLSPCFHRYSRYTYKREPNSSTHDPQGRPVKPNHLKNCSTAEL